MLAHQAGRNRLQPPRPRILFDVVPPGHRIRPRTMLMAGPKPEAGDPIPGVLQEQQGLGAPTQVMRTEGLVISAPFWDWGPARQCATAVLAGGCGQDGQSWEAG